MLEESGSPGLNQKQIASIALASAYATRSQEIIASATDHARGQLSGEEIRAAKAAATLMVMNNIYYRFTHAMTDTVYHTLPANLRMSVMANPGGDKVNFEFSALAVSAINGCAKCMNAHAALLEKTGASKQAVQSAVRIASVISAAAVAREIESGG